MVESKNPMKQTKVLYKYKFDTTLLTLPETHIFAPKNGCLEDDPFLLGWRNLAGAILIGA